MKVFVYFNLHKNLWSVRALEGPCRGKVIAHRASLMLRDCVFKVSEAGRQRVLRERCKNVHAGVVGTLWDEAVPGDVCCREGVTYNPYLYSTFVERATLTPTFAAQWAMFSDNRKLFVTA